MNNELATIFRESVRDEIIFLLYNLGNFLDRKGEIIAQRANLTTLQWIVLLHIMRDPNLPIVGQGKEFTEGGMLASEIAGNCGVSRANISQVISGLIKKGFVRQKDHLHDRRRKVLYATSEGLAAVAAIQDQRRFLNDRLFEEISETDQVILAESLRKLLERVSLFPKDLDETPIPAEETR